MNNTHKSRLTVIFLFLNFLAITGIGYIFWLQIIKYNFFKTLGSKQYHISVTTYPPRATILDRHNKPLALNKDSLSAFILPKVVKNSDVLKRFLKNFFPDAFERYKQKSNQHFLYIKRRLNSNEIDLIKDKMNEDIHFISEPNRFYPLQEAGAIIGITNIDNKGLFGIELLCDQQLMGSPSTTLLEKDARSGKFYFSKEIQKEGSSGSSVTLTIDANLQFLIQEALEETISHYHSQEGGALVMDPTTGDLLAICSYPTFNPNDTHKLILNNTKCRPITEAYEFGSVMKTFSALAALEEKVVTPNEEIDCLGVKTTILEGRTINTVPQSVLGIAPFREIIKKSNNIGIAKVAKRIGQKLYDHYKKLGFGEKTGITFQGEHTGFVMPPQKWSKQSIISLSYGYEISSSLLQLARAFSLFSNDGYLVTPRILKNQKVIMGPKIYSSESINEMKMILEKKSIKTAHTHGAIEGYTTFGKTGTANLIEHGKYNPHKNLFCFVGSIEKNQYKRVIACYIKESHKDNLLAATVTAPLFQKIAEILVMHDKIW